MTAETAVEALKAIHVEYESRDSDGYLFTYCAGCGGATSWPCETRRILDEVKP